MKTQTTRRVTTMTETEAKKVGMVQVGEWGSSGRVHGFWCKPEQRVEVQAAWDAIEEGEPLASVLAEMQNSGAVVIELK